MEAAHDENTSESVYAVLTGWWWDRHEHDGPGQDATEAEEQMTNPMRALPAATTTCPGLEYL